jgi:hypothetical protein
MGPQFSMRASLPAYSKTGKGKYNLRIFSYSQSSTGALSSNIARSTRDIETAT